MQHRAKLADDKHPSANKYFDCADCMAQLSERERAGMRCYWLPEDQRYGLAPVPPRWPDERPDACPGGLVQLPQVLEAARASSWRKDGALREFYGDQEITDLARFCIDLVATESVAAQNDAIRARNEG